MVDGPGPGAISRFDESAPVSSEQTVAQDSKPLSGYPLAIKGGQTRTTSTQSKKSAEQQTDRFSTGTRVMRRQQSLSNIDGLNSFVDFNNGNAPEDQNSNGVAPNSDGAMSGGGGGFGGGNGGMTPQRQTRNPQIFADSFIESQRGSFQMAQTQQNTSQQQLEGEQRTAAPASNISGNGATAASRWTKVGGLSLPIDIPVGEQSLSFSRVGGEAKLALRIRSRELVDTGVGLVWTLVWLGIAATLIVTFSRVSTTRELLHPAVWILFVGGLLSFLILPGGFGGLGFAGFLVGLLALAARFVRAGRTA
jgi:hypothetical protein